MKGYPILNAHNLLPDGLFDYLITSVFEQPRLESLALIRGCFADGLVQTWLVQFRAPLPISLEEYDKLRRAAKSRGGNYTIELCEFVIEETMSNSDVVVGFWRRVRDNTGEGARLILSCGEDGWYEKRRLGGWEVKP